MSDPLDDAERFTNLFIQEGLAKRAKVPEITGECLACAEPTPGAFCSMDCREDYERLQKIKAIRGNS